MAVPGPTEPDQELPQEWLDLFVGAGVGKLYDGALCVHHALLLIDAKKHPTIGWKLELLCASCGETIRRVEPFSKTD